MKKTWFKLYRGWQDSPVFRSDKDKLNWLWLIEHTVHQEEKIISINNNPVSLKRGQLSYSIRYLSQAWGCSESYVRRFLKHLEKWHSIDTANDTGQTVITICNYSLYQDACAPSDTPMNEKASRDRHRSDTNNKKDKKDKNKEPPIIPQGVDKDLWNDFLLIRKKKKAVNSERALKVIVGKLEAFSLEGFNPSEIITTSIENSWKTVYKPKEKVNATRKSTRTELVKKAGDEWLEERYRQLEEEENERIAIEKFN